jgi:hypothetical protein
MDYWVFEDKKRVCIHRGDCGARKGSRGLLSSPEGRVWHGAYQSYGEALTKAKQVGKGKGARINCALCHPQYSARQWDATTS